MTKTPAEYRERQPVEVNRLVFRRWQLPKREWRGATIAYQLTRDRYGVTLHSGQRSVFNIENIKAA